VGGDGNGFEKKKNNPTVLVGSKGGNLGRTTGCGCVNCKKKMGGRRKKKPAMSYDTYGKERRQKKGLAQGGEDKQRKIPTDRGSVSVQNVWKRPKGKDGGGGRGDDRRQGQQKSGTSRKNWGVVLGGNVWPGQKEWHTGKNVKTRYGRGKTDGAEQNPRDQRKNPTKPVQTATGGGKESKKLPEGKRYGGRTAARHCPKGRGTRNAEGEMIEAAPTTGRAPEKA